MIFSIKGEATRLVIVDPTGKIAARIEENLSKDKTAERAKQAQADTLKDLTASQQERVKRGAEQIGGSFGFIKYDAAEKSPEQIKRELSGKITAKEIDAYLIVPTNYDAPDADFEFFSRKAGDFVSNSSLEEAINAAVRSQRLADANISEDKLKDLSQNVDLSVKKISEKGDEKNSEGSFAAGIIIALMIYITLLIYGQQIISAVVEENAHRRDSFFVG